MPFAGSHVESRKGVAFRVAAPPTRPKGGSRGSRYFQSTILVDLENFAAPWCPATSRQSSSSARIGHCRPLFLSKTSKTSTATYKTGRASDAPGAPNEGLLVGNPNPILFCVYFSTRGLVPPFLRCCGAPFVGALFVGPFFVRPLLWGPFSP